MSENFLVEIISPNKSILKAEATEATIPSYEGQMGILKNHIPIITFLRPGLIKIKQNNDEKFFFVEDGTIEFKDNNLLILTSTAKKLDSLDKNSIDEIIKNSEERINSEKITDKEKYLLSHKINTLREINQ
ncbi:MAG: ATP synthase F1 subunit epsilon [Candidatus Pelagibacter sp. TMED253]|nr:MAG: ATP synthase F1 subunit epsilon [Candidatus Pelagibacter sp. TMED253]|tara:strand:+ start:28 stop:420 length:393 start_codon:yes stop_codon:yes gene_type:complete